MDLSPFDLPLAVLRRRTSAKWRSYPDDVLPLWVAEMDVRAPQAVVEAVTTAMAAGDTGYAQAASYVAALQDVAARWWGWQVPTPLVAPVADVMRGAMEAVALRTDPGGAVVINPPVYPPFYGYLAHAQRCVVEAPLGSDLRLDLDALERAFAEASATGPAAYLLCSPQNPTGTVHRREELTAVAELAASYDVTVVVDEIHAPLTLPGATFVPYLTLPDTASAFALHSASKGWNLPGLKAALLIGGAAAEAEIAALPDAITHGASHLGVIAHTAALVHGEAWLAEVIAAIDANRRRFRDRLAAQLPGARYRPGEATYLAWVDLSACGLGADPAGALLERGRLAVNPGLDFGPGGAGHVRVNLATTPAILDEAVDRMAASVP